MFALAANPKAEAIYCTPTEIVPNSKLPVLYYHAAFSPAGFRQCAALVARNGWYSDWVEVDAIYRFTHYHSTAHEVLAVIDDVAGLRLGGPNGKEVYVGAGDLIAIPAGVAHRRISGSRHFRAAGFYPVGQRWDLLRQTRTDFKTAMRNIPHVQLPQADPFFGTAGPLMRYWK